MTKKKNKNQKNISQSATTLKANGLKAFQTHDYDKAIAAWEKIPPALRPTEALTEAYFRRGLRRLYEMDSAQVADGLADLKRAVASRPADTLYAYHLGLAQHRSGNLAEAQQSYDVAIRTPGPVAARAAYSYTLLLLQIGQDATASPAWQALTPEDQNMLQNAWAFRRRPYNLPPDAPALWRALAIFDAGEKQTAQAALQRSAEQGDLVAQGLAHFYLGSLAIQSDDWPTARREWTAAYAAGLRTPRLQSNLAEAYTRLAEEHLAKDDPQTALAAIEEARRHSPDAEEIRSLKAHIHQHLGHQAAVADHWLEAQKHWLAAVELDESSFRLAYNLALAYERGQNYSAAAQAWRATLRRRPRRADHPDALNDDQVARLWQRSAECYRRSGDDEEAIRTYQQAIKWKPDSLPLRLALVECQIGAEHLAAAQNELERILERDPNCIPALMHMGKLLFDSDQWWVRNSAPRYWQKVLQLEPDHLPARQALAEYYRDQAEIDYSWDHYDRAIENYQKALTYQPEHAWTNAAVAHCYILLADAAAAQPFIAKAIQFGSNDIEVYDEILTAWINTGHPERAWEIVAQAEATIPDIPVSFYVANAEHCLKIEQQAQVAAWIERAIAKAPPDFPVLCMIGEMYLSHDQKLARQYLEKAIAAGQYPGQAHLLLGNLADDNGDFRARDRHWEQAESIARRTQDSKLAERVEMARLLLRGPQAFIRRMLDLGPRGLPGFLDDFDPDDFDLDLDDDDDDDW